MIESTAVAIRHRQVSKAMQSTLFRHAGLLSGKLIFVIRDASRDSTVRCGVASRIACDLQKDCKEHIQLTARALKLLLQAQTAFDALLTLC